ncbi:deoxynucleoside kinase [Edaphobacillus lindanitolerans]|uniref:Deoxyguanosine kinase n=1 Tax=Edaphobacillus lindanitolerans TaxID=550447 RepID=A0A1U7PRL6_9BACI|nr:deoxynucleoside kinase [Edaphobacillus lindanitolerans]SIT93469.1 deoxyguanosine kinase [Edaphobacillus lindanitolerans]
MHVPFIAVEGPIGVGKTSLAVDIAETFRFGLLKEIVDENPFLGKFYEDIEEWSFQTEMFFLCNRYKQLGDIKKGLLEQQRPVVADYHIFKNLIFAKRSLQPDEYAKYDRIYNILTADMPMPNVIVYLNASLETLMDRIARRGREFEKNMDPAYIAQLSADYDEFIGRFEAANPDIPVLRFSGDRYDFVNNSNDRTEILEEVHRVIEKGAISK